MNIGENERNTSSCVKTQIGGILCMIPFIMIVLGLIELVIYWYVSAGFEVFIEQYRARLKGFGQVW